MRQKFKKPKKKYQIKKKQHKLILHKFIILIIFAFVFIIGQVIGGIISHSISIISDAGHMLTDLIGFLLSSISLIISLRGSNQTFTYGYGRFQIMGSLFNIFLIWIFTIFMIYQAIKRISERSFVKEPKVMLIIAAVGLCVNISMALILHKKEPQKNHKDQKQQVLMCSDCSICNDCNQICIHHVIHQQSKKIQLGWCYNLHSLFNEKIKNFQIQENETKQHQGHHHKNGHNHSHKNMSVRSAMLHVISDILQSIGVLISAILIYCFGSNKGQQVTQFNNWHYADPICTFSFAILIIVSTYSITKDTLFLLMQATPEKLREKVYEKLNEKNFDNLLSVHNLHIWQMNSQKYVLTMHLVGKSPNPRKVIKQLTFEFKKLGIQYSTIQIEDVQIDHDQI